jgi:multidrug resistance efflux pump
LAKEARLSSLLQALDYSILLSKTEQEMFKVKTEADSKQLRQSQEIRQELERNSDALMLAEAELSRLSDLVNNRFIYASTSGRVQRLRIKEAGKRVSAGAYVMEIAPLTSDFEVISNVSMKEMAHLSLDQSVNVQFSGSSPIPIKVPGRIIKISKVSANSRSVTIMIDRAEINRRDLLLGDRLLNGQGEQAEAVISVQAETAGKALLGILTPVPEVKQGSDVDA